jgi:DNA repair photolyase
MSKAYNNSSNPLLPEALPPPVIGGVVAEKHRYRKPVLSEAEGDESRRTLAPRDVAYVQMNARSVLNWVAEGVMEGCYTINPYRGCELNCAYCYARYTHEYLEHLDTNDFSRVIYVKRNAPGILRRTLNPSRLRDKRIAVGTATDPYQPAERKFEITRGILKELARHEGLNVSITTKSTLITRDLDVLQELNRRSSLTIQLSLVSLDRARIARLEPNAPTPEARLRAVETLAEAGLHAGIYMIPLLPLLTDRRTHVEALAARAREAGAAFVHAGFLSLTSTTKRHFFSFLRREFPHLLGRYRRAYGRASQAPEAYTRRVRAMVDAVLARYGFSDVSHREETYEPEGTGVEAALPFGKAD